MNSGSESTVSIAGPAGSTSDGAFSWAKAGPEVPEDEEELCPAPCALEALDELEAEGSTFLVWAEIRAGRRSVPDASATETTSRAKRESLQFNIIMKSSAFLPLLLRLRPSE